MPIPEKWAALLTEETLRLAERLEARADAERERVSVYPPKDKVWAALEAVEPNRVRAVIVGQDPYHGAGQANGLAFSVAPGVRLPPSLRNIFKELNADLGVPIPESGDLSPWAREGVLLLNTSLTVREGEAGSHSKWGWQRVTGEIFRACTELKQPAVFLLWGAHAIGLRPEVEAPGKLCLTSSHPSPLGATKSCGEAPPFSGSRPFSRANAWLAANGAEPIDWAL